MSNQVNINPIELLLELELRAKSQAAPLPQKIDIKKTWQGLGFRIGSVSLITPLEQVSEILTEVQLTEIPGVKDWVKGIANVRGNLLPIIDLAGLLTGNTGILSSRSRIIVSQHMGMSAGMVVDEILGLRSFFVEDFSTKHAIDNEQIAQFVSGSYQQHGQQWPVIDFQGIIEYPAFKQVAA
ncbi:MAG: chemotaxis protein CheW [Gammaproteobacteria bacterium]|nr:chemotaxis protein CheW [Gammaproteobacteria bacterium]